LAAVTFDAERVKSAHAKELTAVRKDCETRVERLCAEYAKRKMTRK
jgi:hypothetical protein